MEIREMQMEDIEKRISEIREELKAPEADIDALTAEVDAMEARKADIKSQYEERKALEQRVATGEVGTIINTLEEKTIMEEKRFTVDSVEYRNAWLQKMQGKEIEERAAIAISEAGAVIPVELQNEIISKAKEYAPVLQKVTLLQVPGGVKFAVEGTTNAAVKHTENAAITPDSDTLVSVTLSAYEVTKLIQISASVKNMALPVFEQWLTDNIAEAIAMKIEALIFGGSGTGEATGILTTVTTASATGITAANIYTLEAAVKSAYARKAMFATTWALFNKSIKPLQDKSKNDLVTMAGGKYYIDGIEVMFTDSLADAVDGDILLYGDFSKYVANMVSGQNVVKQFDIDHNSYKYLGEAEFDGKLALAEAFAFIQ